MSVEAEHPFGVGKHILHRFSVDVYPFVRIVISSVYVVIPALGTVFALDVIVMALPPERVHIPYLQRRRVVLRQH